MIERFDLYLGMAITGIFSGLGTAIGSYLANKHIIEKLNKLSAKINGKKE